jgi:heterodisulfide reductase subunit B
MRYSYYPGCSLKGTGRAYEESLLAVCSALGTEMEEVKDWNCCGATAYMSVNEMYAFALGARNLAIAEQKQQDLVAPCSACYLNLEKAQHYLEEYPDKGEVVKSSLKEAGLDYKGKVRVRHPLDVMINDIGIDKITRKVTHPLKGVKVAPYYGCQIVRPYSTFDDPNHPSTLDRLLKALGAEIVPYPLKTRCCGGSMTGTLPAVGLQLVHLLLKEAHRRGANIMVTVCPLCQFNLDSYQEEISARFQDKIRMPIVYFTQLVGLAMGLNPRELGLQRGIVSAEPAFKEMAAAKA